MPSIVCIVGNRRPGSFTGRCLAVTSAALRSAGAEVHTFDGSTLDLAFPHEPATEDAKRLKQAVIEADAVILATPEYHGSFSAQAKLMIESLGYPSVLKNKPVALLGVAGGRIGAIKSIEHLRGSCSHLGAVLVPGAVSIAGVRRIFDEDGHCIDEHALDALQRLASNTLEFLRHYHYQEGES